MSIRKSLKSILARSDRIEALFAVDIVRDHRGQAVPTVTIVSPKEATREQRARFNEVLSGMVALFREIYGPKEKA